MTATAPTLDVDVPCPEFWSTEIGPLRLEHGAPLPSVRLSLSCLSPGLSHGSSQDVSRFLVLGGISARRHPADVETPWWPNIVGPNHALDTARHEVWSLDYLGAGNSTQPQELDEFVVTPADQARAIAKAVHALKLAPFDGVVGCSYGGLVALELGAQERPIGKKTLVLNAAHKADPRTTGYRSLQREIVRLGASSDNRYAAVDLARRLAMLGFRTRHELGQRFDASPAVHDGRAVSTIEGYLRACGQKYAQSVTPASFICLSQSCDLINLSPRQIRTPLWLAGARSDEIVPFEHVEELAREARRVERFEAINSVYGHDSFLKETEQVGNLVADFVEACS